MKTSEKSKSKRIVRRGINSSTKRNVGGDTGTGKPSSSLSIIAQRNARAEGTNKRTDAVGFPALSNEYEGRVGPENEFFRFQ